MARFFIEGDAGEGIEAPIPVRLSGARGDEAGDLLDMTASFFTSKLQPSFFG